MKQIAVIVPVYNMELYLRRCVDSILHQTFVDFELILVDNGSNDKRLSICNEYALEDNRVSVIHLADNDIASARNAGIGFVFEHSDAEWISFIDSDDWVHPRYLELLFLAADENKVKISQCMYLTTQSMVENANIIGKKVLLVSPDEQCANWYSAYSWGKLFHKSCFLSIRFPEGRLFEDVQIWYKMLFQLDQIAIVDEKLYFYFQRANSITNMTWVPEKLAQIDAWEDQLVFARKRKSEPVLREVLKRYCYVYKRQCEEISLSKLITEQEKKKYMFRLLLRFRFVLLRYNKKLKEIGIFSHYCSWAYPRIYLIYRKTKTVLRRAKSHFYE